jgi:hypothetical protein
MRRGVDLHVARPLTVRRSTRVGAKLLTRCRAEALGALAIAITAAADTNRNVVWCSLIRTGVVSASVGVSTQTLQQVNGAIGRHKQWPLHNLGRRCRDGSHNRHIPGKNCTSVAISSQWRSHEANHRATADRCRQR